MKAVERAAQDLKALELRRAGTPVAGIVEQLGYRTAKQADEAIKRAMERASVYTDPLSVRDLELDRLDRLQRAVWLKAVNGDLGAIDRVLALSAARMRYAGVASDNIGRMRAALTETLSGLVLTKQHAMHVASAEGIADRVDRAAASGDPMAETKALYLVPHLMNVLEKLGVTAAELAKVGDAVPDPDAAPAPTNDLTKFRQSRGIA